MHYLMAQHEYWLVLENKEERVERHSGRGLKEGLICICKQHLATTKTISGEYLTTECTKIVSIHKSCSLGCLFLLRKIALPYPHKCLFVLWSKTHRPTRIF